MELTTNDIAKLVNGTLTGDPTVVIRGAAGLSEAAPTDISFLRDIKKQDLLSSTKAGAVIVPMGVQENGKTFIHVENPIHAFSLLLAKLSADKNKRTPGIHPTAVVSPTAKMGKNVFVGPLCVIEDNAEIGDNATLMGHVYIGLRSKVGNGSLLYAQVVLREDVFIGERCIIHPGTTLGSDGYGYYFANGKHNKIPHIGNVVIEDDVELGSNCSIDRGMTGTTRIGKGVKMDNLVHIAHNVEIGPNSLILGQVGIAGSTTLGAGVILAGQVGVADHVKIGAGVQAGAQTGIKDDVEPGAILFGTPAQPIQTTLKQVLLIRRLPDLFQDVKKLKKKMNDNGAH